MRVLVLLSMLVGMFLAGPAVAGDCFINSRIAMIADGATEGKPSVYVIVLADGSMWVMANDAQHLRDARARVREGQYAKVCESWGGFSLTVRGVRSFMVDNMGQMQVR